MIGPSRAWLPHSLVLVVLAGTLTGCLVFGYWVYSSLFIEPAKYSVSRITEIEYLDVDGQRKLRDGLDRAKPGDIVQLELDITHLKDCELEIRRAIQSEGSNTDIQLQLAVRSFKGDGIQRVERHRLQIPQTILPGKYVLVNRLRYLCNFVDFLYPIYRYTVPIGLEIVE